MKITINGVALTEGQVRYLFRQMFWKQATGDLNTPDGCEEAATLAARLLYQIGKDGYEPTDAPSMDWIRLPESWVESGLQAEEMERLGGPND